MKAIQYETYRLSRVVSIYAIVSADYLNGLYNSKDVHRHENAWELCDCITGNMTITYNDIQIQLYQGQCFLIPPGVAHKISIFQGQTEVIVISFSCMDAYLPILRKQIVDTTPRQQQQFQQILVELRCAFSLEPDRLRIMHFSPNLASPLGAEQLICCYLEEILIELMRIVIHRETDYAQLGNLATAMQSYLADQITVYIKTHIGNHLSVEEIANHFHYSRNQIGSLYKAATGVPLARSIALMRIEQAKELLRERNQSITEIATELGYSSPQYFSKKFAQETGLTPSQYAVSLND